MFFVIGPLVLRSSFSIRRIVSCVAAVDAVLLLEVAAAGFDGRERVATVVSLNVAYVVLCQRLAFSEECGKL